jgi:hypothetical protein
MNPKVLSFFKIEEDYFFGKIPELHLEFPTRKKAY